MNITKRLSSLNRPRGAAALLLMFAIWECTPFGADAAESSARQRGIAKVEETRPSHFPHRIWAACDFERRLPDYRWFGPPETNNIARYAGNRTALGVGVKEQPYRDISALMTGINPVPGPRMGKVNQLYLRYYLRGATEATFQHFSLSSEDNNQLRLSGLTEGRWAEATMNFSRDARRNDGTPGVPFRDGERMDDLKIFVGRPAESKNCALFIDDVIFFANDQPSAHLKPAQRFHVHLDPQTRLAWQRDLAAYNSQFVTHQFLA